MTYTDKLIEDARLAAGILAQAGEFETGQAILLDCADALTAQQKRIAELERDKERLIEDRARFPDRPDWVGDMIGAHYGNMENRIRSAESYTDQYRMRWSMEQRKRQELEAALEDIVTWGNSDHCKKLREKARAALQGTGKGG